VTDVRGRDGATRVLVLDAGIRQSLAACRALGRAGYEVGMGGYSECTLAAHSRYTARYHVLPDPSGPEEPFRLALEALLAVHGYEVVISTDDATLARLAGLDLDVPTSPSFGPGFRRLTDKASLAAVSAEAGVAYPITYEPADDEPVESVLEVTGLPVVVKGARSADASEGAVHHFKGAVVALDVQDAGEALEAFRADGLAPIVQRRVEGVEKLNAVVLRARGRSEFRYVHRVLREVPIEGGTGIALETISPDAGTGAEVLAMLERLCDAAGFEGLAQAEFYRDRADRRLYVIDVNPRLWGSTWFAERLGLEVADRAVRFALGRPRPAQPAYPTGRRFHHLPGEVRWLLSHGGRVPSLRELAATVRPWDVFEYQDGRDPFPLVRHLAGTLRAKARRGARDVSEARVPELAPSRAAAVELASGAARGSGAL
jgi:biotin carboxylase